MVKFKVNDIVIDRTNNVIVKVLEEPGFLDDYTIKHLNSDYDNFLSLKGFEKATEAEVILYG